VNDDDRAPGAPWHPLPDADRPGTGARTGPGAGTPGAPAREPGVPDPFVTGERPAAAGPRTGTGPGSDRRPAPEDQPPTWYCGPAADRWAYAVVDPQGYEGGQGRVVRAERRTFPGDAVGYEGQVSLKLITDHRDDRVQRLYDRWSRLAAVDHPQVARALEVFEGPGLFRIHCPPVTDDVLYVAAAWAEGQCLRDVAPLDPREAFAVARDVAAGLAALHAHDLVHRDIHPGNVVVDDWGRAVLIDLGSARPDDAAGTTTTAAGALGFIPPETTHTIGGPAADRWGLGMVTAFALLGCPRGGLDRDAFVAELTRALAGIPRPRQAADLILAMTDPEPARRPDDAERWAGELTRCLSASQRRSARRGGPEARRRWRRAAFPVAAAVAILALGAAGVATDPFADDPATDDTTAATDAGGGPVAPPDARTAAACAEPAPGAPGASTRLIAAVTRLAPEACAAGPAEIYSAAEVQPLADGEGDPDGVVIVSPEGAEVRLTVTMWTSYRGLLPRADPENIAARAGYPISVEHRTNPDAVVIELDQAGFLMGRREDTQMFWLPREVLNLWEEHGGMTGDLGFPTSNPYLDGAAGEIRLDFEHGYMSSPASPTGGLAQPVGEITAVVLTPEQAAAALSGVDVRGAILRQAGETAWSIDGDGVRHWVPDVGTYRCLGGPQEEVAAGLAGWAVATLPLGEPATCQPPSS
jgi:hypothetical protein